MSEIWRALTEADVLTVLAGEELAEIRAAALADEQVDPVQPAIDQVTERIRGDIAAGDNALGPAGTIAPNLIGTACALLAVDIPGRLNTPASEVRELRYKSAERLLERVAAGRLEVIAPTTEATEEYPTGSGAATVTSKTLKATGALMDGL